MFSYIYCKTVKLLHIVQILSMSTVLLSIESKTGPKIMCVYRASRFGSLHIKGTPHYPPFSLCQTSLCHLSESLPSVHETHNDHFFCAAASPFKKRGQCGQLKKRTNFKGNTWQEVIIKLCWLLWQNIMQAWSDSAKLMILLHNFTSIQVYNFSVLSSMGQR